MMDQDDPFAGDAGALFRRLVEDAPDAMLVADSDGVIRFVNRQTEKMFGYDRNELLGQTIEALIPARHRAAHVASRRQFTRHPHARPMGSGLELFGRRKDGSDFAVEVSLSPFEGPRGRLTSAAIRDVSERRRIEAAARHANQLLMNAVESFQGGFALYDPAGQLVMCNSTYRALLGRDLTGEIVGKTPEELIDANLATGNFRLHEPVNAFRARWQSHHQQVSDSFELEFKDGRHFRMVERETADGGRVATILDVSADVEQARQLSAARAQAEAASSAKSEFLSSMSHELRTPLNAVLGFAQLLQRDKRSPLSDRQRERLQHVVAGGEHLLRLIDDILDLSRVEAGRITVSPEAVSIPEVIEEVVSTLQAMASRCETRLVIAEVPAPLPRVHADRTRFVQILMNYGSNAIKYGKRPGTVRFTASLNGATVRVVVEDDGIGIPAQHHDKIFQPFQRAGQETGPIEGTGIGLSISRRLAQVMGGEVGFTSEPGRGSAFWVDLPSCSESFAIGLTAPPTSIPLVEPGQSNERQVVLYIEDNPSNLALMRDFMSDLDHLVLITAPTAEIGIELARTERPKVILMDINLPGMSGLEATKRLRGWPETRDIPVIGLSAAAMIRDGKHVMDSGFREYLTKPVNVKELARALEEALADATQPTT